MIHIYHPQGGVEIQIEETTMNVTEIDSGIETNIEETVAHTDLQFNGAHLLPIEEVVVGTEVDNHHPRRLEGMLFIDKSCTIS